LEGEEQEMLTVGAIVARLRKERNLSQRGLEQLSEGAINKNWLASLERNRIKDPPPDKMKLLAKYLEVPVARIYELAGIIDLPPEGASPEEARLIRIYRSLPARYRLHAIRILEELADAESIEEKPKADEQDQERPADRAA
jgi:transcriptional regulator with XRE-family HTH domain